MSRNVSIESRFAFFSVRFFAIATATLNEQLKAYLLRGVGNVLLQPFRPRHEN